MAKRQGWQKGEGKYSGGMGKDPIKSDRSTDNSGNPVGRPKQLDIGTLDRQGLADRLPKRA